MPPKLPVTLLIIFSLLAIIALVPKASLSPPQALSGFGYYREITITNSSTEDLTDYQIKLTIDTQSLISDGKMNPDCSDIRFTDSLDNPLPYYLESGCNTPNTVIWVKVPSIPASGSTTIRMYYYNPSATSESDPSSVFDFFDSFDGTSLDSSKWQVGTGCSSVSVSGGVLVATGSSSDACIITSVPTFSGTYVVESKMRGTVAGSYPYVLLSVANPSTGYRTQVRLRFNTHDGAVNYYDGSWSSDTVFFSGVNVGTWYLVGQNITSATAVGKIDSSTQDIGYLAPSPHNIWLVSHRGTTAEFDYVIVRKYADPEPTYTIGPETSPIPPPNLTLEAPSTAHLGSPVTISATSSYDSNSYDVNIDLYIDSHKVKTCTGTTPLTCTLTTMFTIDGNHQVKAESYPLSAISSVSTETAVISVLPTTEESGGTQVIKKTVVIHSPESTSTPTTQSMFDFQILAIATIISLLVSALLLYQVSKLTPRR